jgi:hypothetical protein
VLRRFLLLSLSPTATLRAVIKRALLGGLTVALALSFGCSSGDTKLERRGPPLGGSGGSGGSAVVAQGGDGDQLIPFCDALAVIRARCQRCHQDPPQNTAPVKFITYEDTQAQYFDTNEQWWQVMQGVVDRDFMPYLGLNGPPTNLMPPVQPLTAEEKATLLGWLNQGAMPVGGTECP